MNKYQKFLINACDFYYVCNGKSIPCLSNEQIVIKQNEDITITKYMLSISKKVINTIFSIKEGVFEELKLKESYLSSQTFDLEIDFENRIEAIKIVFIDNLADDLIIPIVYQEASKELYFAKKEQERKESLIKNAQIKHSTGEDLVNIYFQPCNDNCAKTVIELWIAKGKRENHHGMIPYVPKLIGGEPEQLIAKYNVEEGAYFKSINGLAKGVYGYKIMQYDKENNIIMESDFNYFDIGVLNRPIGRINRI